MARRETPRTEPTTSKSVGMLSRREAAEIGELSLGAVDKAIEQAVIEVVRGPRREAAIPTVEIAALAVMHRVGLPLPKATKREIRDRLVYLVSRPRKKTPELEVGRTLFLRVGPDIFELVQRADRYTRMRSAYIDSDPEVKGGEPVIRGTRLTASAVAARLAAGDTTEDLVAEYPYIDREAFEAAAIYARAHPRRGRPPRPQPPDR